MSGCRRWIGLWACVLAAILSGCATTGPETRQLRLIPGRPFEADLPVPAGFSMVESASEDRSTGISRLYLRHLYEGKADKHSVRNFYREQMPLARWIKVSDGNVKGNFSLRFEKGSESCTIEITDNNSAFKKLAQIQIIIAREERGDPPPTRRTGS